MFSTEQTARKAEEIKANEVCGRYRKSEYISRAMQMARMYHAGQTRLGEAGRVPYFDEHIMGVYHILKDECGVHDRKVLTMALLHDTVEDTACTFDEIEEKFGTAMMEEIRLLTRIEGEPFSIYARRLFANGSCETVLVKMADRLHNLRTILYMPDKRWIEKKMIQTYTDILNPLPDTMKRIDGRYNRQIRMLADKIEDQLLIIQRSLDFGTSCHSS